MTQGFDASTADELGVFLCRCVELRRLKLSRNNLGDSVPYGSLPCTLVELELKSADISAASLEVSAAPYAPYTSR